MSRSEALLAWLDRTSDWLSPIVVKEVRQIVRGRDFMSAFGSCLFAGLLVAFFGAGDALTGEGTSGRWTFVSLMTCLTILGVAVGFLFAHLEKLAHIFDPLMVALNAMPRVVLAPLFILWFGLGLLSKVVMVISLVFFVVFFSTFTGLREVDRDLINNARILGATPRHIKCVWGKPCNISSGKGFR